MRSAATPLIKSVSSEQKFGKPARTEMTPEELRLGDSYLQRLEELSNPQPSDPFSVADLVRTMDRLSIVEKRTCFKCKQIKKGYFRDEDVCQSPSCGVGSAASSVSEPVALCSQCRPVNTLTEDKKQRKLRLVMPFCRKCYQVRLPEAAVGEATCICEYPELMYECRQCLVVDLLNYKPLKCVFQHVSSDIIEKAFRRSTLKRIDFRISHANLESASHVVAKIIDEYTGEPDFGYQVLARIGNLLLAKLIFAP